MKREYACKRERRKYFENFIIITSYGEGEFKLTNKWFDSFVFLHIQGVSRVVYLTSYRKYSNIIKSKYRRLLEIKGTKI